MLYEFFSTLTAVDPGFDVFRYITFRTALSVLTALGISFLLGPWIIGRLKTVQPGEYVREYVPEGHLLKAGIPIKADTDASRKKNPKYSLLCKTSYNKLEIGLL